ncbi:ATP-citrate synthase beta chain protein 2-like [Rutidosis leptorrhynchoides]|uniref:ATP-citrate synthase beta chain protein 2-like n=1 Tax=Rutidosis leptorrhynchoides TaxID=125765 RepID=UPI003A990200
MYNITKNRGLVFVSMRLHEEALAAFTHLQSYLKMIVLGELCGQDKYSLVEALKSGKIDKSVCAWVSGTCARLFMSEFNSDLRGSGVMVKWTVEAKKQAL